VINAGRGGLQSIPELELAFCSHCKHFSLWVRKLLVYPATVTALLPNPDLPDDVKVDYDEARRVANISPRSAAALLRLAVQKLCTHLGQPGKNLNTDIGTLVEQGLPTLVQKSLDAVRVIGNNAVHPGTIDLNDDPAVVAVLFRLVNLIAEKMISEPRHVDEVYGMLPEAQRRQVEERDKKGGPA
jgi:hypothetical protein